MIWYQLVGWCCWSLFMALIIFVFFVSFAHSFIPSSFIIRTERQVSDLIWFSVAIILYHIQFFFLLSNQNRFIVTCDIDRCLVNLFFHSLLWFNQIIISHGNRLPSTLFIASSFICYTEFYWDECALLDVFRPSAMQLNVKNCHTAMGKCF